MKIYIYSEQASNRLKYVADLVFTSIFGVEVEVLTQIEDVYDKEFLINYSRLPQVGYHIVPNGFLFEKKIVEVAVPVGKLDQFPTLFPNQKGDISFDVFSAIFYLVSRYEEYLPHKRDKHGRYDPKQSIAYVNGFLDRPIVNEWVGYLKDELEKKYPQIQFRPRAYEFINTIDVDYAFAYKEKGVIRTFGAATRDFFTGKFSLLKNRLSSYFGWLEDPFDTFDYLLGIHKKWSLKSVFFFHVGDYDVNDKSIPIGSPGFQSIIKGVNDYADVGIHPSYASGEAPEKVRIETKRLSKVVHQPVYQCRFHFIKIALPQSYRNLIEMGITEDYTMGYASEMGFRAGICSPFYFYDLDYDSPTALKVYPFYLMEATIRYYLDEGPENAFAHFKKYIDIVKKNQGVFVSVWHNDALSELDHWAGWKSVYEQMILEALPTNESSSESD